MSDISALEQEMLELINRARMDPGGEYDRMVANGSTVTGTTSDITNAMRYFGVDPFEFRDAMEAFSSVAPLAWNINLSTAAAGHSADLLAADAQSHQLPGGPSLVERVEAADYDGWSSLRENVFSYTEDPFQGHAGFLIDWGYDDEDFDGNSLRSNWQTLGDGMQDPAGHRNSIMSTGVTEVGIGIVEDSNTTNSVGPLIVTQDFGSRFNYAAQVLGVVIDDADGDRFYDAGEGLGGINVAFYQGGTLMGSTTTWDAGGYQIELAAGTYDVTFSGLGLEGTIETSVTLGTENVKLDAVAEDAITGATPGNDVLMGTAGDDAINALAGLDWIVPGRGNDTLDGGDDRDMVSYSDVTEVAGRGTAFMLDVDLGAGTAKLFGGDVTTLANIERVTGSIFADVLRGSDGDDELRGIGDYDWFVATAGNDTLDGGNGLDMVTFLEAQSSGAAVVEDVFSGDGAPPVGNAVGGVTLNLSDPSQNTGLAQGVTLISVERVTGSSHQDVFFGDGEQNDFRGLGGYDWFVGSAGGRERYFGGDGMDTVTYYQSSEGVTASLRNGASLFNGQETGYGTEGDALRDLYFEIENLVGSNHDDSLTGNDERNQISGLDGDDFIFGYGGNDYMKGGAGEDLIDGGAGSDYALYDGSLAEYTLTRTSSTEVTIAHADGTDTLRNVEYFEFDDATATIWDLAII